MIACTSLSLHFCFFYLQNPSVQSLLEQLLMNLQDPAELLPPLFTKLGQGSHRDIS